MITLIAQNKEDYSPQLIELKSKSPEFSFKNDTFQNQIVKNDKDLPLVISIDEELIIKYNAQQKTVNNNCLICNEITNINFGKESYDIFKHDSTKGITATNLWTVLSEILEKEIIREKIHSLSICSSCHDLLKKWDDLKTRMKQIQRIVTNSFQKTSKRFNNSQKVINGIVEAERRKSLSTSEARLEFEVKTKCRGNRSNVKRKEKAKTLDSENNLDSGGEWLPQERLDEAKRSCDACGLEASSPSQLAQHRKSHFCSICGTFLSFPSQMKTHLAKVHNNMSSEAINRDKPFRCNLCQKRYSSGGGLHNHKKTMHSATVYPCGLCDQTFRHPRLLAVHSARHGERRLRCSECDASFFLATELNKHINGVHRKVRAYQCHICSRYFCQRSSLTHHLSQHTTQEEKGDGPDLAEEERGKAWKEEEEGRFSASDVPFLSLDLDPSATGVELNEGERDRVEIDLHLDPDESCESRPARDKALLGLAAVDDPSLCLGSSSTPLVPPKLAIISCSSPSPGSSSSLMMIKSKLIPAESGILDSGASLCSHKDDLEEQTLDEANLFHFAKII